jgi:hypothetical protein
VLELIVTPTAGAVTRSAGVQFLASLELKECARIMDIECIEIKARGFK